MEIKDMLIVILVCTVAALGACWHIDRSNMEAGLYVQAQVDCGCGCDCRCEKNVEVKSDYTSIIEPIADPGEVKRIIRDNVEKDALKKKP